MTHIRYLTSAVVSLASALVFGVLTAPGAGAVGDPDVAAWQRNDRPDRLVVIRPHSVSLVERGSVVQRLVPPAGVVPLSWLAARTGGQWIAYDPGDRSTVRVGAAVLLTPDTILRVDERTKNVLMSAGRTAASGTWIRGSRAALDIEGVTLSSVGADGSRPAPADAPGRPYLAMGADGRLDIRGSTVEGFGRVGRAAQSGVTWGRMSTGSVTFSTFDGNRTGLRLSGSSGVTLREVTVQRSAGDGIVLEGDRGTTADGLTAQAGGGGGIVLDGGPDPRVLTGVVTRGNGKAGVRAVDQDGLRLESPVSHGDRSGVELSSCANCTVSWPTVHDTSRDALRVDGAGSHVTVERPRLNGNGQGTGIRLASGIAGARVTGGKVVGFARGIGIEGSHTEVSDISLAHNRTGVTVGGRADRVALQGLLIAGGHTGVTVGREARHVTLSGFGINETSSKGLVSASPGLRAAFGRVSGATSSVVLEARADLRNLKIDETHRAVHLSGGVRATGRELDILAQRRGIQTDHGARMALTDSRVRAPMALTGDGSTTRHGRTSVSLPPFPWLGAAALSALLLAVLLQTIHHVRHRRTPRPKVAAHVRNTV
ncbi:right-handed parallel beta-helix repeat-containing protein [Streptomyces sp. CRN 30]|uniref:right-handed parallel beta-helix repeat-containing protein n=1 Tax=Streptomyces sp. CRN 30 TaxID=3075613 RepID=UPI002A80042F|nr:right-handed parallel beta-helix repeat-containing protein [Streptomyces sp. CRN 30]